LSAPMWLLSSAGGGMASVRLELDGCHFVCRLSVDL
jgi:hypothetical protein